jgi:thiol-disulfide isomerase/thioredoxin
MSLQALDEFEFYTRLEETSGVAVVLFTAPHCGSCRAFHLGLTQLSNEDGLVVFEVDSGMNPGLVQAYEVFHLPALFLFVDGRYHAELQCEPTPAALRAALAVAQRAPAQDPP